MNRDELNHFLANNRFDNLFEELEKLLNSKGRKEEVQELLLLQARYQALLKNERQELWDHATINQEYAKIRNALLGIIDDAYREKGRGEIIKDRLSKYRAPALFVWIFVGLLSIAYGFTTVEKFHLKYLDIICSGDWLTFQLARPWQQKNLWFSELELAQAEVGEKPYDRYLAQGEVTIEGFYIPAGAVVSIGAENNRFKLKVDQINGTLNLAAGTYIKETGPEPDAPFLEPERKTETLGTDKIIAFESIEMEDFHRPLILRGEYNEELPLSRIFIDQIQFFSREDLENISLINKGEVSFTGLEEARFSPLKSTELLQLTTDNALRLQLTLVEDGIRFLGADGSNLEILVGNEQLATRTLRYKVWMQSPTDYPILFFLAWLLVLAGLILLKKL